MQNGKLPFYYVIVVWGEEYVKLLTELTLPCAVSPGNLPAMRNLAESRFLFITTTTDANVIRSSTIFQTLSRYIKSEFICAPWLEDTTRPYQLRASQGHQVAAERALKDGTFLVYLCPDCLFSDGSLAYLERMARAGKRAVVTTGLRLNMEASLSELAESRQLGGDKAITIAPRELCRFALRHLHAEVLRYNWNHPFFTATPQLCTWNVDGCEGLLIRAFHLHPLLVSFEGFSDFSRLKESTVDGDFLGPNISDWSLIHVETDSDNIALFSLTPESDRAAPMIARTGSVETLRTIAFSTIVNPLHRHFFTKAIKFHTEDLSDEWEKVEGQTNQIAYEALRYVDKFDKDAALARIPAKEIARHLCHRIAHKVVTTAKAALRERRNNLA